MITVLHILHLEDDAADARLIGEVLRESGMKTQITVVVDRQGFLAAIRRRRFDLILADYRLPGFDGLEALVLWRERWPSKPFLFVTGFMGEDLAVESLRSGATDYVLKENLSRLVPAITRAVAESAELSRRERAEAALRENEERMHIAQQAARWGVFDYNLKTGKNYWSRELEALYGLGAGTFEGTYEAWQRRIHPEDRERAEKAMRRALKTGEYSHDFRIVWNDGSIHWLFARAKVFRTARGRPQRLLGVNVDITERKQAEEALRTSLREKEVLLREVHHRVKNNLQVISSLVSLQSETSADPGLRTLFQDVCDRVRTMSLVHEKLYESESLARVNFAEYARSLLDYLWRAHGHGASGIRLNLNLQPVTLPMDMAVPCGLLLNEVVTNALKHAFRGRSQGELNITLGHAPDGLVRLDIRDDGVGLPTDLDWRQARSLGLKLVQLLAGQLNSTMEVSSNGKGRGTEFRIRFGGVEIGSATQLCVPRNGLAPPIHRL